MKCSVYIAASLDGFVARADGGLDWLKQVERPGEDYGYARFMATVDTLIVGRATYELALGFEPWPYAGKHVVVLTHRPDSSRHGEEFYAGELRALLDRLSSQGLQHAYVDGPRVIQQFLAASLVQSFTLSVIPVLLGRGIPLFGPGEQDVPLALVRSQAFESGLVQLEYGVDPAKRAPLDPKQLAFRPLTRADLPLLHAWFNQPHARRWYGQRKGAFTEVEQEYLPTIERTQPIEAFIVLYGERPIGMLEWMRFGDFPESMPFYGVTDPNIVNCDVIIGEPDMAHRGLAAPLIRKFLREKVFVDPRFVTCIIDPEVPNKSAIRAYEKAGFRHLRTMPDDGEGMPIYLMELHRKELEDA